MNFDRQSTDKPVPRTVAEKADWMTRHETTVARLKQGDIDLCFVGDSIAEWWEGPKASKVWNANYLGWKSVNCGVGGDCTQHTLWRLRNGALDVAKPKVIVLLIGTNNADIDQPANYTVAEVDAGISAIVGEIRQRSLALFDRTFAVTYLLEAVAVLIGLFGISASTSSQVLARRGEFGMLRHLGVTRREIGRMLGGWLKSLQNT
jgi:ABC-type antimicrobial peptide transport system permease subunit